ncbi:MAG: molybdopterin molybdotransferase MoeA [Chthoniobacterales bacterium]
MIGEEPARARILQLVSPRGFEKAPLGDALDRFAARELLATIAVPPLDNSAMDGYAVRANDARSGARLQVIGEQPAGAARDLRLGPGEAVRIFTGAPVPEGVDAVVMQEETTREGDEIVINAETTARGDFVRKAGGDLIIGQTILERGERLRPATLGLLASQGIAEVEVFKRARVAVVTTGDEVVAAGRKLRRGEIYESNAVMLSALAQRTGAKVIMQRHCADDLPTVRAVLEEAVQADALIISGGVSVGARDFVRAALEAVGAKIDLWQVKIKPGKPFLFGTHEGCAIFGLPGNPVSSFVTFMVFVRPALLRMMGATERELELPRSLARLAQDVAGDEKRPHYLRGKLKDGRFTIAGRQESHALFGLAQANALLRVSAGEKLEEGSEVTVSLIS